MARQVFERRFGGRAARVEDNVERRVDPLQPDAELFPDATADPVPDNSFPYRARDSEADSRPLGSRRRGSGFGCGRMPVQKCHKIGTRKTAAVVVDFPKVR